MFLDIHLEGCDDNGERLEKIAKLGKPFNISVVPVLLLPEHELFRNGVYPHDYHYPKKIMGLLKELAKEKQISFGQQGFTHYCPGCFKRKKRRDPWHENRCLYGQEKSIAEQMAFMGQGKNSIVENIHGVCPSIYATPNHQGDENTKIAASVLDYEYLAVKDLIGLAPYMDGGLKILPQRKVGQSGIVFYTHYDKIAETNEIFEKHMEILKSSIPLSELEFVEKPLLAKPNEWLVLASKFARDAMKLVK